MKRIAGILSILVLIWVQVSAQYTPPSGGGGAGTVTSVGLAGTANQITVTGATPITGSGAWTLSFPVGGVTLPGTTTGTFSGPLTGNVTGNVSGSAGSVTTCNPLLTVCFATVTLSSANIKNLDNVQVIAAPGASKALVLAGDVGVQYVFGTSAYPINPSILALGYGDTQFPYRLMGLPEAFQWGSSFFMTLFLDPSEPANYTSNPTAANQPLKISWVSGPATFADGVATSSLGSGGAGYAVGDTGYIDAGDQNAQYEITGETAGAVTGYTLLTGGSGYSVANGVATVADGDQPGIGTGFTVDVLTLTVGDGVLHLTIPYSIITLQ